MNDEEREKVVKCNKCIPRPSIIKDGSLSIFETKGKKIPGTVPRRSRREVGRRVDDDHDGYPAGSSHTGGGTSGTSDPVYPVAIDLTTNLRIVSSPEGRNTDDT
jgi:hypothetical protein